MSTYTIHHGKDRLWRILKDGEFFSLTHSKLAAERTVAALSQGNTPTPIEFNAAQVLNDTGDGKWNRQFR